jgi:hypothetical protein
MPTGHTVHAVAPETFEYAPAKHTVAAELPVEGAYQPGWALVHDVCAGPNAYQPGPHLRQPAMLVALPKVPFKHGKYDGLPRPGE